MAVCLVSVCFGTFACADPCHGAAQGTHFVTFDDGDKVDLTLAEEAWRRVWPYWLIVPSLHLEQLCLDAS